MVVTCGGLCPGLNDVIRGIVMTLYNNYGVTKIWGIPMGYKGFLDDSKWSIKIIFFLKNITIIFHFFFL